MVYRYTHVVIVGGELRRVMELEMRGEVYKSNKCRRVQKHTGADALLTRFYICNKWEKCLQIVEIIDCRRH